MRRAAEDWQSVRLAGTCREPGRSAGLENMVPACNNYREWGKLLGNPKP